MISPPGPRTVLLVEDAAEDRLLVRRLLERSSTDPVELVEATSLPNGLALLRERTFDLLLLDHTMPGLTSLDELRLVRQEHPDLPVILHTGYIAADVHAGALRLGAREVVLKVPGLMQLWAAIQRALDPHGSPQASGRGRRVLVTDDADVVRRMMRITLELAGYVVIEAESGLAALNIVEAEGDNLALVVSDVLMPGLSGRGFMERVRELRPGLPVLLVSGLPLEAHVAAGRLPADATLLQKPFYPDMLVAWASRAALP